MSEEIKKSQDNELHDAFMVELRDGELVVIPTKVFSLRPLDPVPSKILRVKSVDGYGKHYRSITCKEDDILRAKFELIDAEIQSNENDILEDNRRIKQLEKQLQNANRQLECHKTERVNLDTLKKSVESEASGQYETRCFMEWNGDGEMPAVRHLVPKDSFPTMKVYCSIKENRETTTIGVCSEENIQECRRAILKSEYAKLERKENSLRDEYTSASQRIVDEKKKIEELM